MYILYVQSICLYWLSTAKRTYAIHVHVHNFFKQILFAANVFIHMFICIPVLCTLHMFTCLSLITKKPPDSCMPVVDTLCLFSSLTTKSSFHFAFLCMHVYALHTVVKFCELYYSCTCQCAKFYTLLNILAID